ncbi:3445_t:CDS:2, partial [Paraglomus occultum]
KILTIREDDLKLVNIEQNYNDDKYKQAIEDYFKTSVLEKEKTDVDNTLTKKTSIAIQRRISDLLPEETGDQVCSKKPRLVEESQQNKNDNSILMSADSKINQGSHSKILPLSSNDFPALFSSSADPSYREEEQHFNAKKGKNIVDKYRFQEYL